VFPCFNWDEVQLNPMNHSLIHMYDTYVIRKSHMHMTFIICTYESNYATNPLAIGLS